MIRENLHSVSVPPNYILLYLPRIVNVVNERPLTQPSLGLGVRKNILEAWLVKGLRAGAGLAWPGPAGSKFCE